MSRIGKKPIPLPGGVKVQIGIAKRLKKPIRYYDITDMPYRVVSVPEAMLREE